MNDYPATTTTPYLLEMRGITKDFSGVRALNDVAFCVQPGEVHALVGENGAGKSTLIKILAGALPKTSGTILVRGREVEITNPHLAQQLGIAIIYQEFVLAPTLSAVDNIFLGRERRRFKAFLDKRRMLTDAVRLLGELGASIDATVPVATLTVAQRQMVEIAKALLIQSEIIVMDEPSAVLTTAELEKLFSIIHSLKAKGKAVIYISHRLEEVFALADRVTVLRDGAVTGTAAVAALNREKLIQMMVGRTIEQSETASSGARNKVVLEVRNLGGGGLLQNISFQLHEGETLGIAGLVGAGRTELARAIFGADPKTRGEIFVHGKKAEIHSPKEAVRLGLGLVTEDRKELGLIPEMHVGDNMLISNYRPVQTGMFVSATKMASVCSGHIRQLDVRTTGWQQKVKDLSGGNQQKTILARWLNTDAKILILDEPTRGIDIGGKRQIHQLIRELAQTGKSIIMISSELPEILTLSDRILVMHEGRMMGELTAAEATEEKILHLATGEIINE